MHRCKRPVCERKTLLEQFNKTTFLEINYKVISWELDSEEYEFP